MVEFKGKFDENVQKSVEKRSFKIASLTLLPLCALVLIVGIIGAVFGEDAEDLSMGIYLICLSLCAYPFFCLLYVILRKLVKPNSSLMSAETEQQFQFFEDRFMCNQVKGNEFNDFMQAKYSVLFRVIETKEQYFLYLSRTQCFVINKVDLTSGTIDELNRILTNALTVKFKGLKK